MKADPLINMVKDYIYSLVPHMVGLFGAILQVRVIITIPWAIFRQLMKKLSISNFHHHQ